MSELRLPRICDLKFDLNNPLEREAAFAWLRAVVPVLTNVERRQVRQYLRTVLRGEQARW
jgi:hypothetical protein